MKPHRIVVLPAPGCQRSKKILNYLQRHGIPFTRIDLHSLFRYLISSR